VPVTALSAIHGDASVLPDAKNMQFSCRMLQVLVFKGDVLEISGICKKM
jgi:hypothetical protein